MNLLPVLLSSGVGALMAGFGALVSAARPRPPLAWLGWANAVAAGLMLGVTYALTQDAFARAPLPAAIGSGLGVAFVFLSHRLRGTDELRLNRTDGVEPAYARVIFDMQALHSASEGVAIGVGWHLSQTLGLFLVAVFAIHNVAEGLLLSSVMRARGATVARSAGLAIASNVSQVLMAVVTVALLAAVPPALPWVAGFAAGALANLILVELLPEAYHQAGPESIALVTSLAAGVIALGIGLVMP